MAVLQTFWNLFPELPSLALSLSIRAIKGIWALDNSIVPSESVPVTSSQITWVDVSHRTPVVSSSQ